MGFDKLTTLEQLEALSRTRALTPSETLRLERALRGSERKYEQWHWTRADNLRLRAHLLRGRKPKAIAIMMKRSERAVWQQMQRLGWTVRAASVWIINPSEEA